MACKKILLIPAYQPQDEWIHVLKEIDSQKYFEIIVIDDGSGADFKKVFEKAKKYAVVVSHDINKGKGEAIKTGLRYIKANQEEPYVIVTMDCDLQHTIKDAKKLCEESLKDKKSLMMGIRNIDGKIPWKSKLGNRLTRFLYYKITGIYLQDTQTGLRAFSNELVDFLLKVKGERYEYEMNVLLNCHTSNIPIKEIEISTIYKDQNSHSHFRSIKDSFRIYQMIIKYSLASMFELK